MLTVEDKSRLRSLITSPEWRIIEGLRQEYNARLLANPKKRDTEWETLAAVLTQEGMIEGVNNFFQELFNQAK